MEKIEEILERCGVFLKGHFVLVSWRRAKEYFEKANLFKYPSVTRDICWEMAGKIKSHFNENKIEVVIGLAPIGVVLANRVAEYLYQEKVISLFVEKEEKRKYIFERGYNKEISGKKIFIVDDVLTTGRSVGEVMSKIKK